VPPRTVLADARLAKVSGIDLRRPPSAPVGAEGVLLGSGESSPQMGARPASGTPNGAADARLPALSGLDPRGPLSPPLSSEGVPSSSGENSSPMGVLADPLPPQVLWTQKLVPGAFGGAEPVYPAHEKPLASHLRSEVLMRAPHKKSKHWKRKQLVKDLFLTRLPRESTAPQAPNPAVPPRAPLSVSDEDSVRDDPPVADADDYDVTADGVKQQATANKDLPRIMNCVALHRAEFLTRDQDVSPGRLTAMNGLARKGNWSSIARTFKDRDFRFEHENELKLLFGNIWEPQTGLSGIHSGYVMTAEKAEDMFKEHIRKPIDLAMGKWERSGMGDDNLPVAVDTKFVLGSNFENFFMLSDTKPNLAAGKVMAAYRKSSDPGREPPPLKKRTGP